MGKGYSKVNIDDDRDVPVENEDTSIGFDQNEDETDHQELAKIELSDITKNADLGDCKDKTDILKKIETSDSKFRIKDQAALVDDVDRDSDNCSPLSEYENKPTGSKYTFLGDALDDDLDIDLSTGAEQTNGHMLSSCQKPYDSHKKAVLIENPGMDL